MSDTTQGTAPADTKATETQKASATPAAKATAEAQAETVTDKTAEPVATPKTTTKAKAEPKTAAKTAVKADEKPEEKSEKPEITINIKNDGVTLFETRSGTILESGKTTIIKVADEKTRDQVLKNIEQLNYLHGDTLDVK